MKNIQKKAARGHQKEEGGIVNYDKPNSWPPEGYLRGNI